MILAQEEKKISTCQRNLQKFIKILLLRMQYDGKFIFKQQNQVN